MPVAVDPRRRPVVGLVGVVAVAALALTGCSAGQQAQTVEQTSVVDGVGFKAGAVELRDVGLRAPSGSSYAAGANAALEGLIVNTGDNSDRLVSVSSPAADQVLVFTDGVTALLGTASTPSASASSSESPSDVATPTQAGTPTETGTPTEGASATTSTSTSASGTAPKPLSTVTIPSNESVQFGYTNQQLAIVFVGLTEALFPAQSIPVTFTFANGGSTTATISVKLKVDQSLDAPTINTEEGEGGGE